MGKSFFPLCDRNLKKTYGAKNARKTRKNGKNPLVFVHITRENRQKSLKSPKIDPKKRHFFALFRARPGPPGNPVFAPGTGGHPPTPPGVAPGAPEPPQDTPGGAPRPPGAPPARCALRCARDFPTQDTPLPRGYFRRRKPPDRSLPQGGDTSERACERPPWGAPSLGFRGRKQSEESSGPLLPWEGVGDRVRRRRGCPATPRVSGQDDGDHPRQCHQRGRRPLPAPQASLHRFPDGAGASGHGNPWADKLARRP